MEFAIAGRLEVELKDGVRGSRVDAATALRVLPKECNVFPLWCTSHASLSMS